MRKIIDKNFKQKLPVKVLFALFGGLLFVSCGTQIAGYSETDGVYYDPETDILPEQIVTEQKTKNSVGEYYDYSPSDDGNVIKNGNENLEQRENRYSQWNSSSNSTEWGDYNGTEVYYDNTWDWNYGWGMFSPYWGSRFGYSFGWGSPWSWSGFAYRPYWNYPYYGGWSSFGFDPYWGYYSPYALGYYQPYLYGGGLFSPYYAAPHYKYRRSGANGRNYNTTLGKKGYQNTNHFGTYGNRKSGFRSGSNNYYRKSSVRSTSPNSSNTRNTRYRSTPRNSSNNRTYQSAPFRSSQRSSGGFRSGGSSSRSGRSGSGFRR